MTAANLARAAEGLVGCRFRLHGRDPATGLDCIGLLAAALQQCGCPATLPQGYPLRLCRLDNWLPDPASCGFVWAQPPWQPGDVVLIQPGTAQFHLAIAGAAGGWVHAHAGLRRVVHHAQLPPGPVVHHWRFAATAEG